MLLAVLLEHAHLPPRRGDVGEPVGEEEDGLVPAGEGAFSSSRRRRALLLQHLAFNGVQTEKANAWRARHKK